MSEVFSAVFGAFLGWLVTDITNKRQARMGLSAMLLSFIDELDRVEGDKVLGYFHEHRGRIRDECITVRYSFYRSDRQTFDRAWRCLCSLSDGDIGVKYDLKKHLDDGTGPMVDFESGRSLIRLKAKEIIELSDRWLPGSL